MNLARNRLQRFSFAAVYDYSAVRLGNAARNCSRRHLTTTQAQQFNRTSRCLANVEETRIENDERQRVVVLGSGWAGYTFARQLNPKKFQVVVISPRSYFAFTPLLASTSVGTLEFRTALEPVRSRRTKVEFLQGWADAVDFENKTLTVEEAVDDPRQSLAPTSDRNALEVDQNQDLAKKKIKKGDIFTVKYDRLVVAVGCYSQTFGTTGVKEHAYFLKDVGDARRIRNRLLTCFEMASLPTTSEQMKRMLLNFTVVGGGPTGIEFSAELHDIITEDLARLYPELTKYYKITVYDVAPKVLPMFDEKLGKYAMERFRREGISIKTLHHVEELRPGPPKGTELKDDHLIYTLKVKEEGEVGIGMCIWSTGLMSNPFIDRIWNQTHSLSSERFQLQNGSNNSASNGEWKAKKRPRQGSIVTDDRLHVLLEREGDDSRATMLDVFAIGDCATQQDKVWPATAQVANQKAEWLAKRFNKGDWSKDGFNYKNMGVMAYLGNWNAILDTGSGGISGRTAWFIWRGAYLTKSVSWRNKILIPIYWVINWMFGRDISRF